METFNQNRLHIVMNDYLLLGKVPSPASANAREPILGSKWQEIMILISKCTYTAYTTHRVNQTTFLQVRITCIKCSYQVGFDFHQAEIPLVCACS